MFEKILIANRGEIACRIIRTCRDLGIATVAVYSEADRHSLHVLLADEAVCIGPAPSSESYLLAERILSAARQTGAQAIHPGYGFLSENADFRRACDEHGVVFVGPPARAIDAMGTKTEARTLMEAAQVPVVPGSEALQRDQVESEAARIGYPVMLKAAAGGGGKGMQVVARPEDLLEAFDGARRTAISAFGDERVYLERFVEGPRHIEIQVLADAHGAAVHLFERECSVQRRHQKIVEEAPASRLSEETRQAMGAIAVQAARAIDYTNAGTVEFLVDAQERFYFLEMNTRLQVEHPVTEWITGVDLVAEQLRIAAGQPLTITQDELSISGHAVECRLYAEDPDAGFMPSPGTITRLRMPHGPGVRVDSGVYSGAEVSRHYDPMIAKIAVWGPDRETAIARSRRALSEVQVGGIRTNQGLLADVLSCEAFTAGRYDTGLLDQEGAVPVSWSWDDEMRAVAAVAAAMYVDGERSPASANSKSPAAEAMTPWRRLARARQTGTRTS